VEEEDNLEESKRGARVLEAFFVLFLFDFKVDLLDAEDIFLFLLLLLFLLVKVC